MPCWRRGRLLALLIMLLLSLTRGTSRPVLVVDNTSLLVEEQGDCSPPDRGAVNGEATPVRKMIRALWEKVNKTELRALFINKRTVPCKLIGFRVELSI